MVVAAAEAECARGGKGEEERVWVGLRELNARTQSRNPVAVPAIGSGKRRRGGEDGGGGGGGSIGVGGEAALGQVRGEVRSVATSPA